MSHAVQLAASRPRPPAEGQGAAVEVGIGQRRGSRLLPPEAPDRSPALAGAPGVGVQVLAVGGLVVPVGVQGAGEISAPAPAGGRQQGEHAIRIAVDALTRAERDDQEEESRDDSKDKKKNAEDLGDITASTIGGLTDIEV